MEAFKQQVEDALEELLRQADARVSWQVDEPKPKTVPSASVSARTDLDTESRVPKDPSVDIDPSGATIANANVPTSSNKLSSEEPAEPSTGAPYTFLPGVYDSIGSEATLANGSPDVQQIKGEEAPGSSVGAAATLQAEELHPQQQSQQQQQLARKLSVMDPKDEKLVYRLVLHGDNTFEYHFTNSRRPALASRAMEYSVEIHGDWRKPVMNRTRRGECDQSVHLTARKMRFQRCSNFDPTNQTWKLCLKTLVRNGSDWVTLGDSERAIEAFTMVLQSAGDDTLISAGDLSPSQLLTNSLACRVLAGLTKKVGSKLGTPLDVMTDKWLPSQGLKLYRRQEPSRQFKKFNPLLW